MNPPDGNSQDPDEASTKLPSTRKQRQNRNKNKNKENNRQNDLGKKNKVIMRQKKLRGIVRFTRFTDLDSTLQHQFENLSTHLIKQSMFLSSNTVNPDVNGGTMFNAGSRKAYGHNKIMGISASIPKIAGHEINYEKVQEEGKLMEEFLACQFANMSLKLYELLRE
ncbi:hypothetical protein PSHT_14669 [Puccinia striiformis]|uniref:Tet-like 2OG-Fe(II) oxygenase domain-containing protein n=1 Tax=Puccinia striiformis TaxID=27350 RepID=A0A2S4UJD9_9BASI|nr:hypothetical protein PSHT_14669 [Puccinia striiformis]